jgi:hypothetical protein
LLSGCLPSFAASITGAVRDISGSPLAGAVVLIRNVDTGYVRTLSTGPHGDYRATALPLGAYEVQVDYAAFRPHRVTGVRLSVERDAFLEHSLEPAPQQDSATVTASVRSVDASLSGLSHLIPGETIREQPLNGRDYLQLALLQPGVTVARAKARTVNTGFGVQLSIGGARPVQNNFRLDGISLTDYTGSSIGSVNGLNLGVDTLREFSVLTNGFSAEYGRAAGGVVNAATLSGTNDLHGSAAYFHRNDNLDARNYFDPQRQPEFRRHQFATSLGGPIRRNRTFFFAGYEGFRQERGNTPLSTTLSEAVRSRPGIHPSIAPILPLFPLPNLPSNSAETGLFQFTNPLRSREDFLSARLDHQFSERRTLLGRYTQSAASRRDLTAFAVARARSSTRQQSAVVEETHVLSPHLTNSFRFGVARSFILSSMTEALRPALDDSRYEFVPNLGVMGCIDIVGLTLFPGGSGSLDFDRNTFTSFQLYDDVSYVRGRHWFKFGAMLERTRLNSDSQSLNAGEYRFPTVTDFLLNRPDRFRALLPGSDTVRGFRQWIPAWYLQDRWRLTPRFSLELGLRHEWITVPAEVQGKLATLETLLSPAVRVGSPLFANPSRTNFAPRLGLAWDLFGSGATIIRAGYGIYHDQLLSQFLLIAGLRNPPAYRSAAIQDLSPGAFPTRGYQEMVNRPTLDLRAERLAPYPRQPYVQQWNFNIQQNLGPLGILRLAYAGSHGLNLSVLVEDANLAPSITLPDGRLFFPAGGARQNPNFSVIRDRLFEGHSFYQSFQTSWERRAARNTLFSVAYVLSKSIDDDSSTFAQTESENSIGLPINGKPRFNRGLSNHDVRHHLVTSLSAALPAPGIAPLQPLLSNWRVSSIATAASGAPFTVTLAYDAARSLTLRPDRRGGQRPDLRPGVTGSLVTGNPARWYDVSAFARPEPGFLGNLGRNTLTGPGLFTIDFALTRQFAAFADHRLKLDLRLEAFNLFNRTNFDLPAAERMQVFTRTGIREDAGRITSASPARELQFGLKFTF